MHTPAVALGLGVLLLGEPFTVGILVGFARIVVGSLVANRRDTGQRQVRRDAIPDALESAR